MRSLSNSDHEINLADPSVNTTQTSRANELDFAEDMAALAFGRNRPHPDSYNFIDRSPEELRQMVNDAPAEVIDCLRSAWGEGKLEAIMAGTQSNDFVDLITMMGCHEGY